MEKSVWHNNEETQAVETVKGMLKRVIEDNRTSKAEALEWLLTCVVKERDECAQQGCEGRVDMRPIRNAYKELQNIDRNDNLAWDAREALRKLFP